MINPSENQNRDHLIQEVLEAVKDIQIRFQTEEDEEKQWLIQNSPNPAVEELIKEMTVTMLHVLDAIGTLEPVNGITISKQFGFSKGTVSKITRRLVSQNIIVTESLPYNKKEVLFRTTTLGKEIYRLHQGLHHQIDLGFIISCNGIPKMSYSFSSTPCRRCCIHHGFIWRQRRTSY